MTYPTHPQCVQVCQDCGRHATYRTRIGIDWRYFCPIHRPLDPISLPSSSGQGWWQVHDPGIILTGI